MIPGKFHPSQRQWPSGMPESIRETTYKEPLHPDSNGLNLVDVYCPNEGCKWHVRVDEKVKEYNLNGHMVDCPVLTKVQRERYRLYGRTGPQEHPGDEEMDKAESELAESIEALRTSPVEKPFPNFEEEKIPRTFETGATRDTDDGKLDYEGFLSPLVLQRYAEFMHTHRFQSDGELRDSDNWQKGIPQKEYMKSGWRHFMAWYLLHRDYDADETLEEALCALIFNASGYLHELLRADDSR
jgi:hypothetical protein